MKPRVRKVVRLPLNRLILSGSVAALFIYGMHAANQTWNGGSATDGNWATSTNWLGGAAPGSTSITTSTDIATFNAAIAHTWGNSAANPVVIDANRNVSGISFTTAAGNYFIGSTGGNTLLVSNGGAIQILSALTATNAIETVNAPLQLQGAAYTLANNSANGAGAGAGTLNIGGGITGKTGTPVLTLGGSNTNANTVSGIIANGSATSVSVTKTGAGLWILSGTNTYTGGTTVSAGTLDWLNTSAQPASGLTTVAAGATLALGVDTSAVFFTSANVDSLFVGALANVSNSATSNVGIDTTAGDFTYASSVPSTTRGFAKLGNNTLFLSGTNNYTGGTTVSAGTLDWLNTHAKPASGTTTVASGATLALGVATSGAFFTSANLDSLFAGTLAGVTNSATSNVGIDTTAGSFTYASSIPATTRGLTKLGANTLTLTGSNSYTGPTTVSAGTLQAGALNPFGINSAVTLANVAGATLDLQSNSITIGSLSGGGTTGGSVIGTGVTVTIAGTGATPAAFAGTFTADSTSTLTVNGFAANAAQMILGNGGSISVGTENIGFNFAGSFTQNGGTNITANLNLAPIANSGAYTLNGGLLQIGSFSAPGVFGTSTFNFNGGTLQAGADQVIISGLTAANVQAGGVIIDTQTFGLIGTQTLGLYFSDSLLHDSSLGATPDGGLTKLGSGTLVLSGANTYTGGTTVSAGTLDYQVTGAKPASGVTTVASGATLALGVGTGAGLFTSANVDSLFAGTLASVSNPGGSGVGIDTTAGNFTYASSVPSTIRGLVKLGGNVLILSGTNSYTGGTSVISGTLDWLNTHAKPASGITTAASGTTLALGVGASPNFFTSADVDALFAGTMANVSNSAYNIGIDTTAGDFIYATSQTSVARNLIKLGANTLTYSGTYSGHECPQCHRRCWHAGPHRNHLDSHVELESDSGRPRGADDLGQRRESHGLARNHWSYSRQHRQLHPERGGEPRREREQFKYLRNCH